MFVFVCVIHTEVKIVVQMKISRLSNGSDFILDWVGHMCGVCDLNRLRRLL